MICSEMKRKRVGEKDGEREGEGILHYKEPRKHWYVLRGRREERGGEKEKDKRERKKEGA